MNVCSRHQMFQVFDIHTRKQRDACEMFTASLSRHWLTAVSLCFQWTSCWRRRVSELMGGSIASSSLKRWLARLQSADVKQQQDVWFYDMNWENYCMFYAFSHVCTLKSHDITSCRASVSQTEQTGSTVADFNKAKQRLSYLQLRISKPEEHACWSAPSLIGPPSRSLLFFRRETFE